MATSILHQLKYISFWAVFWARTSWFFSGLFIHSFAFSQGLISQTEVTSFTRNEYEGGTQNWAITQDINNRLYVANNEGLLVYNGTNWQLHPMPNKTIVRSIGFGPEGKLYAGAQDELGYYAPDQIGRLQFTSLKHLLPVQNRRFTDVWQLEATDKEVFFRTNSNIFKLSGENLSVYPTSTTWLSMHKHQGQIVAHDSQMGVLIYQNNQWQPFLPKDVLPPNFFITDMIPYQKGSSLLSTVSNGLYILTQNKLKPYPLKPAAMNVSQHFTSLCMLNDSSFLAGTYFNGIYHISKQGLMLENISTKNGLPNNTVRCVFVGVDSGVWAGLDNGLAFFTCNNVIKHINPLAFNNGIGYDVKSFKDDLYFALSTGLMYLSVQSTLDLSAIAQEPKTILDGLTWSLSVINQQIFAGRDDGLFVINNKQANPISQSTGYWACRPILQTSPMKIISGNYLGTRFFEIENKKFTDIGFIEKFKESSRYIETEGNAIWVSHPYRGIYRITLPDKSISLFSQKNGLPTDLDNHVFKIKGKIVFATPQGIYEYDPPSSTILKSKMYSTIFGQKPIRYLKEDEKGNIWFVQDKMIGVVDFSTGKPKIHYIPELKNKIVSGFENIFPYNSRNILVGGEPGFYHLNYEKYLENIKPFSAYVSQVKTSGAIDSVLFGGYVYNGRQDNTTITIPYKLNSLLFAYTASVYGQPSGLEYSYYLQGFDLGWSDWDSNTEKEYTNLPAGTYTFQVKARKSPSHESSVYQFSFTITPPWYQTIWAYIFYFILSIGFLFALLKYQALRHRKKLEVKRLADLKKFEEEQKQQAYLHQFELAESEKEIVQLRNEKLDAEIKHKNAELANATMNLVQKKEFILKLKKELQQFQKNAKVGNDNVELKKLLKILAEEEKLDEEWDNFLLHFNVVHRDFLTILKKKFPTLNPRDLRLCAYLRMNLNSKEIAPLLGISLRGVEISRYRLRKKLALPTEINLTEYLLNM
ncbi:MAG: triple tyrosine motif-containing protein [Microscillaceae bacterium]|nr:triple tyrosine motif-containing protein [Microscillaceae bacterium]